MGHLETRAGLAGKVAVIFGGGGGLGRAAAQDLGLAGVRLCLADRNEELLSATAAELGAAGVEVMTEVLDARDPEALGAFYGRVDDAHGRLDVLVNVVGGTFKQSFEESNPRGWDAIIRTNFTWLLHARRFRFSPRQQVVLPVTAVMILACTFAGKWTALCAGGVAAASVVVSLVLQQRASRAGSTC